MSSFNLLISEVPHDRADDISNAALAAGSFGGTVCMGRSISANALVAVLGFGSKTVDLVFILTEDESYEKIFQAIENACSKEKPGFGKLYSITANDLVKTGRVSDGGKKMAETERKNTHELITVIVNKGYADDAMAAARRAGAGGGTVINARGTAKEDDEKFFGMHIVPEKEMLMIVVPAEKKEAVLESIRTLPCLSQPGSGIAFCAGVEQFKILGKK